MIKTALLVSGHTFSLAASNFSGSLIPENNMNTETPLKEGLSLPSILMDTLDIEKAFSFAARNAKNEAGYE